MNLHDKNGTTRKLTSRQNQSKHGTTKNKWIFVVLFASLLFTFCVVNAKATETVIDSRTIRQGGEWNTRRSWTFNVPRDVRDLHSFQPYLKGHVSDREDVLPLWEIRSKYGWEKISDID